MDKPYVSTRNKTIQATSKQAVLQGIAPDGGLFVYPQLGSVQIDLDTILAQNYKENAVTVLSALLPDYTEEELKECVEAAYTGTFETEDITPLKKVDDVYVLELFRGPTSAFKDVALTLLPQLMSKALKGSGKKAMILTATSGDTGKAALSGFSDVEDISIAVFYPDQGVSAIQHAQMTTQKGKNVEVYGVKGNFDDAQSQVKKLFLDEEMLQAAKENNTLLTSANSINIGRLVPQIVYYFEAYKQLVREGAVKKGEPVSFSVPTGNFGDVLAGYYAWKMGLPVKKFYVASNANNVLTDFFETGVYNRNRPFYKTISPSMDILISSNLERLLYYITGQDNEQVAEWMQDLAQTGSYSIGEDYLKQLQELFAAGYVDDEKTRQVIADVFEKTGEVLDPHTAIGYAIAQESGEEPVVSLATASPFKFSQDVLEALGQPETDEFQAMNLLSGKAGTAVPAGLAGLKDAPVLHDKVISILDMKEEVISFLKEQA